MLKMNSQIENIVSAYKTLSKIPSIVGGRLNKTGTKVASKWSVRNLDKMKNTKYQYSYTLDDNLNVIAESDFGIDVSNELLSAVSPKETFRAVIREDRDNKDVKKQYLEVWQSNRLAHAIDLSAIDVHSDVYADSEFGSLDWSPDERSVVYVAEKKLPKSEPFIKRKKEKKPDDGSGETPTPADKGEEYLYKEDWGEQLVGKHQSVIVVCQLETETLTILEGLPDGCCPGQVRFKPDGKSVYGVAWEGEPRRLGLIYCTNRPSFIFSLSLDGNFKKISPDGMAVRSPRWTPQGTRLVWLQRSAGGPHHACHSIESWDLSDESSTTNVFIVTTELQTANHRAFYGVYSQSLPARCFSNDGRRMVFSTPQQTEVKAYVVDNYGVDGGRLLELNKPDMEGSLSILDVQNDVILAVCSNMTTPGQLLVGRLPPVGSEAELTWHRVSAPVDVPPSVASAHVQYLTLAHDHTHDHVKSFTAVYMSPQVEAGKKVPLVVWPHGGPHSNFVNAYSLEAALFVMLGLASVRINFRGSIGYGDDMARCLIGKVKEYDTTDCLLTLAHMVQSDERIERAKNWFLYGGSYGGLVATNLAGQYPELFTAMTLRNPLIDMATKGSYCDNSESCAVEAGFEFTEKGKVTEEQLLAMRRCSPLVHVHKVVAPTALMLGSADKRVPHYQGLEFYRRLKANGVDTRLYMYDDNHTLSSLPAEMDNLVNGVNWFLEHLEK